MIVLLFTVALPAMSRRFTKSSPEFDPESWRSVGASPVGLRTDYKSDQELVLRSKHVAYMIG